MKEQAKPTAIAIAVVVLVAVLGLLAWRTFTGGGQQADMQTIRSRQAAKSKD